MHNVEGLSSYEDDHYLAADHDNIDSQEKPIVEGAFKDIEFVIKPAITMSRGLEICIARQNMFDLLPLVENLHPHECVEYECRHLVYLSIRLIGEYRIGTEI